MNETLIQSWVNPMRRFIDEYYVPHQKYVKPEDDTTGTFLSPPMENVSKCSRNLILEFLNLADFLWNLRGSIGFTTSMARKSRRFGLTSYPNKSSITRPDHSRKVNSFTIL